MNEPTQPTVDEATEELATRILVKARQFLQLGWCQNTFAKTPDGRGVSVNDPDARSYCALGAMRRAAYGMGISCAIPHASLVRAIVRLVGTNIDITCWNDSKFRTHEEVLQEFDRAIGGK